MTSSQCILNPDIYYGPHEPILWELHTHHLTIRYHTCCKVRSEARLCNVSSRIQPCHRLDYEEENRRTSKSNYMDNVFFSRGYWLHWWRTLSITYFTDDVPFLSHTRQDMQEKTNRLREISQKIGLVINKKKPKVIGLNLRNPVLVYILQEEPETTDIFTYLHLSGKHSLQRRRSQYWHQNRVNEARGSFSDWNLYGHSFCDVRTVMSIII